MLSCLNPRVIKNPYSGEEMAVPCGHCSACVSLHVNTWKNRLYLEASQHSYVYFLTLTYTDDCLPRYDVNQLLTDPSFDKEKVDAVLSNSCDYLGLLGSSLVPRVNIRDVQLFFKKVRYYISQLQNVKTPTLRYFLVAEYGPTTFRPHYHCLLFFDDPAISHSLREIVYKSWKFANTSSQNTFHKRNMLSRVCGDAVQYVAGYLNCTSQLPPILTFGVFRPFHTCSKQPPIGLLSFSKEKIFELLSGSINEITCKKSTDKPKPFSFHLWTGFEGRFVPKCRAFSHLSQRDRISMYRFSSFYGKDCSFEEFFSRLCCQWFSSYPAFVLFRSLFGDEIETPKFRESIRRAYYLSKRFSRYAEWFGFTIQEFALFTESYYSRKEYSCLVNQLCIEQKLLTLPPTQRVPLPFHPFLIDSLFYANLRSLPSQTYDCYLSQFGITQDLSLYQPEFTALFRKNKSLFDKIINDSVKRSRKSDYVSSHPEYLSIYLNLNPLLHYV